MIQQVSQTTIREAYVQASSFLQQHKIQDAAICAELLLCDLFSWSRSELFLHWNELFPKEMKKEWASRLERKAQGEPVQYIIGEQSFYGLTFQVNPAVLIPRPETELLVEKIIAMGRQELPGERVIAADIGTGSGAIAITLAIHCPDWIIYAVDISAAAIEVAKKNAILHGVADRICFLEGDLLSPLIELSIAPHIIVSNPPYICSGELTSLQVEVREYEPLLALDGGPDGLQPYRRIIGQMAQLVRPSNIIGFEAGSGQAGEVQRLMTASGYWNSSMIISDLAGIDRHIIGIKPVLSIK